jgi:hypothetical protein
MLITIGIFLASLVQDFLVTAWTRAVAVRAIATATAISFITSGMAVALYGSIIHAGDPIVHVTAWAAGSAAGTWLMLQHEDRKSRAIGWLVRRGRCKPPTATP